MASLFAALASGLGKKRTIHTHLQCHNFHSCSLPKEGAPRSCGSALPTCTHPPVPEACRYCSPSPKHSPAPETCRYLWPARLLCSPCTVRLLQALALPAGGAPSPAAPGPPYTAQSAKKKWGE
eukprot:1160787-Pelagomonas_calceolata.AAC.2